MSALRESPGGDLVEHSGRRGGRHQHLEFLYSWGVVGGFTPVGPEESWSAAGPTFGTGVTWRSNTVSIAHGPEQALRTQRYTQRSPQRRFLRPGIGGHTPIWIPAMKSLVARM